MRMMKLRTQTIFVMALAMAPCTVAQKVPPTKNARILLLPRKMVSGDRVTLAVLDVNGRLTAGATIAFSNGDHVTTNATGRAVFVAPLTPGVLYATIQGRPGRLQTVVLPSGNEPSTAQILEAPHFAS